MKKTTLAALCAIGLTMLLAACGGKDNQLLTKEPFPQLADSDMNGNPVTSDIFSDYDVTIVNFWNNGCGTCIAEMPYLEELYQEYKEKNINLIGVGADSGESDEQLKTAQAILNEKGVTYTNICPDPEESLYKDLISEISGYPTTYLVDREGNIIGAPIIGDIEKQEEQVKQRIDAIVQAKE